MCDLARVSAADTDPGVGEGWQAYGLFCIITLYADFLGLHLSWLCYMFLI